LTEGVIAKFQLLLFAVAVGEADSQQVVSSIIGIVTDAIVSRFA
jgi:hypothetical protein